MGSRGDAELLRLAPRTSRSRTQNPLVPDRRRTFRPLVRVTLPLALQLRYPRFAVTARGMNTPDNRRILLASLTGTAVEFYDFYIYATAAALVFGPLFFPTSSVSAQLMLSYASFGLAFVARPVGAVLFGHFGDRIGRKSTLVASLLLMGGSTVAIAFLPTYAQVGWVAPLLLCVLRFGQGLGLGGEWGGAVLLATENAPPGRKAWFGMFPQLGAPVGFLLSGSAFLLLTTQLPESEFLDWGWRIPFVSSALLVLVGLYVRLNITETPEFRKVLEKHAPVKVPMLTVLTKHTRALVLGMLSGLGQYVLFYLLT
eukprot:gene33872-45374_t